jgi:hypothetical protein
LWLLDFVRQIPIDPSTTAGKILYRNIGPGPSDSDFPFECRLPSFPLPGLLLFEGLQPPCRHLAQERTRRMEKWVFILSKSHEKPLPSRIFGDVFIVHSALILLTLSTGLAPG